MAARAGVGGASKGPKTVAGPIARPSFVLGSRPASMRSGQVPVPGAAGPRIKPGPANTTQYGKMTGQPNPAAAGADFPGAGAI